MRESRATLRRKPEIFCNKRRPLYIVGQDIYWSHDHSRMSQTPMDVADDNLSSQLSTRCQADLTG